MLTRNGKILSKHGLSKQKSLCYLEIYRAAQNTEDHLKKPQLSMKGISYFKVVFILFCIKQPLICFKDTFTKRFQLQMFILYQSMRICKDGLSSLRVDLTNYKDEVPNVSDSNQNIETTCKLIKLKDLFIKSTEKNIQR